MAEAPRPPLQISQPPTTAISDLERTVMATVTLSETRGDPPWLCAAKVAQCCGSGTSEPGFPNADLASILVSNLCFSHNTPSLWKLLEQAMATQLVYPLHVLALLTPRVIPNRKEQPKAYRLYLELMRRYAVSFSLLKAASLKKKVTTSIDVALQLSDTYGVEKMNFGMAVVLFLVNALTDLLDCILDDWGLLVASEAQFVKEGSQSMHVDMKGGLNNNRSKYHQQLRQPNVFTALEVMEKLCSSKFVQVSLRLVYKNLLGLNHSMVCFRGLRLSRIIIRIQACHL
ncbi:Mediator of RNA polymerase II transcription subunit 33A [Rhynchospora pubera]|uniref:Mediator of RNA polymerase II transcription subunit 33A n=1 Tax=Rhynchospora pubera TaxID=906938 RepID=A0AAV8GY68_9POAL|nr:Mediator of RNA polymerase II transcription subunit 33A [Rhynchospora pubera]